MIKLIEILQVVSAFGILGTVGEMEVNYEMTIGEGVLQAVLFFAGILLLEVVKMMYLGLEKKNTRRRAAAESKNTKCGLCDWKTKPMCSAPKSIDFGIARAAATRKTGVRDLDNKSSIYYFNTEFAKGQGVRLCKN